MRTRFGRFLLWCCVIRWSFVCVEARTDSEKRTVGAWISASDEERSKAIVEQLLNKSWTGLFDVAQVGGCGWHVVKTSGGSTLDVNETQWKSKSCQMVLSALEKTNITAHAWIGSVPDDVFQNPQPFIDSAVRLIEHFDQISGIHWDDETECAPRATLSNFSKWMHFNNLLADALHDVDAQLSAAVQAIFGIVDEPYVKNAPCANAPWKYNVSSKLLSLLSSTRMDRLIEMDTYYFTLSRYLDALDWHAENIPLEHLGVAVANRDVNPLSTPDEYLARMHALTRSDVNWFNIFMLPADDAWLDLAWRWKTRCEGCPSLACFELGVACDRDFR